MPKATIAEYATANPGDVVVAAAGDRAAGDRGGAPKVLTLGDLAGKDEATLLTDPTFSGYTDYQEIPQPANPGANTLRLFAEDNFGLTTLQYVNAAGQETRICQDNLTIVRNTSGSTITKGSAVYITGASGNRPTVALAKADAAATMPSIGIVFADISNNADGFVMKLGRLTSLNTTAFTEGDRLFVSAATAGALTSVAPAAPNLAQNVGTVVTSNAGNGRIFVDIETIQVGAFVANAKTEIVPATPILLDEASGNERALDLSMTVNKAAGAHTLFYADITETAVGGNLGKVFDIKANGLKLMEIPTTDWGHISIGLDTGGTPEEYGIQIGHYSGKGSSAEYQVFIGYESGRNNTGENSVAIGWQAGDNNTGNNLAAVGWQSGVNNSGQNLAALGKDSGISNSAIDAVAVGFGAGHTNSGNFSILIGGSAGNNNSGSNVIAIGKNAGLGNTQSGRFILGQASLPQFANETAAISGMPAPGANGVYLYWDTTHNVIRARNTGAGSALGGAPGGSDTQLQYNNAGAFGGMSNFTRSSLGLLTYDPTLNQATGNETALAISPTVNKATSGNYNALNIAVTETAAPGSDNRLINATVGGADKFLVDRTGRINSYGGELFVSKTTSDATNYERAGVDYTGTTPRFKMWWGGTGSARNVQYGTYHGSSSYMEVANAGVSDVIGGTKIFEVLSSAVKVNATTATDTDFTVHPPGGLNLFHVDGGTKEVSTGVGSTFVTYNVGVPPSPTNYERGGLRWNSNFLELFTEFGGTGTRRGLRIMLNDNSNPSGIAIGNSVNMPTASGSHSLANGTNGSTASGARSWAWGTSTTASGPNSIAWGDSNLADADHAQTFGSANRTSGLFAACFGAGSYVRNRTSLMVGGGGTSQTGQYQGGITIARAQTTNATPTTLQCYSTNFAIASDQTVAFIALVVARRTDADNESAAYKFEGCIDNNAGTTALVGSVTKTVIAEDTAAWDVNVTADDTLDFLKIEATGEAGKTIRWTATVITSESLG